MRVQTLIKLSDIKPMIDNFHMSFRLKMLLKRLAHYSKSTPELILDTGSRK